MPLRGMGAWVGGQGGEVMVTATVTFSFKNGLHVMSQGATRLS